jgi:hypothetical protein
MSNPKCEATKAGLFPKSENKKDIDKFRNSVDPDMMGFDGEETPDLSEFEDDEEN